MQKQPFQSLIVALITLLMVSSGSYLNEHIPPSLADHIHFSVTPNASEECCKPQLQGLPNKTQVALLTQQVIQIMKQEKDPKCTSIDLNLRMMIFQHFLIYQHLVNAEHVYFTDEIADQWAHVLAMILKESSGDASNITDMGGHSISTDESKTNLLEWKKIVSLTNKTHVKLTDQTNFGLTQTSSDRLFNAFCLTRAQKYDTTFLQQNKVSLPPAKPWIDTAIAIRRMIWFYQDFAQGRTSNTENRIVQNKMNDPKLAARYQKGIDMALLYCGTRFMFGKKSPETTDEQHTKNLEQAMSSIAYCQLGNPTRGYGVKPIDQKCFAEWVTLCPALNVDIATLTPLSYYATRNVTPVCKETFKRLINKKPNHFIIEWLLGMMIFAPQ